MLNFSDDTVKCKCCDEEDCHSHMSVVDIKDWANLLVQF